MSAERGSLFAPLYCQACGDAMEKPPTSTPIPRCKCGAWWWASYPPSEKKKAFVMVPGEWPGGMPS